MFSSSLNKLLVLFVTTLTPSLLLGQEELDTLKEGNHRFVNNTSKEDRLTSYQRKKLAQKQTPFATVLACSDSRVSPELIFDQGPGDLFVIRIAGNIIDQLALASIEYGIEYLKTPLLIVLGHQNCGAVKATFDLGKKEFSANIAALLSEIEYSVNEVKRKHPKKSQKHQLDLAIKHNVEHTHQEILNRSPVIRQHLENNKLKILNAMFYIDTGKVSWETHSNPSK